MNILVKGRLAAALVVVSLWAVMPARAQPPSEASVEDLLQLTRVEAMMGSLYANVEASMRQGMQQGLGGRRLNDAQQKIFDEMPRRFIAVMREELGWAAMKADIVRVYVETFDQAEVDGLIAFYRSPLGQAFIDKTPLAMQRSIAATQARMQTFLPRIEAAMQEAMREIRAAQ